jgi:penicillin-binding protein 1A
VLNPERAQARRNTVLAQMKKRGKLGEAEYAALSKRPLRIRFERQVETAGPAPHLAQQLRKQLIDWADRNGYSLYADGLVIRTTIDYRLQQLANQAVARQGRALQGVADGAWAARNAWNPKNPLVRQLVRESARYEAAVAKGAAPEDVLKDLLGDVAFLRTLRQEKTRVQAGFMALDPRTGEVRAWVGSRDFAQDPFDHVQVARRQPGSTFKPFVYGAAFDQGLLPTDTLMDAAVEIPLGNKQVWRPTDGNKPPSDMPMTLSDGLAFSKNTITAQLMQQVGPLRVAQLARAMGVRESKLDVVPSLALGTSPVSLKEMVAAYGAIASGGSYRAPRVITRIEDKNGKVLEDFAPTAPERVLGLTAAQQLRDAMRGVVDKGTGVAIRSRYGISADVAGKTGTTQDNTDGWFILMHPQLVAGAWVGFNDGRITLRSDYWGQGAHSALPMVGEVFQQALRAKVIDGKQRFIDEEESNWVGTAVAGVRNWVYDLFGRRTGGPEGPERTTGALPVPGTAPAEAERPEITEAPLVPLENAMPRVPPLPPVTYDEEPEATSPEMAPVPQPGVVITLPPPLQSQPQSGIVVTTPVQRGVVVPAPVPAQGNVPIWVESRP